MKALLGRRSAVVTVVIAAALILSGCAKSVNNSADATKTNCGSYAIAMHAWGGYTASAQVVAEIAKKELGCTITQTTLDEGPTTYDAMEAGTIDVIIEDWGGGRWKAWTDRGSVVDAGLNGNVGLIGMYVAPWMVAKYPDITDSKNLNKYASLFKTADSGGKGAWYEGPPGYTTIGEKMVAANKLNFKVIFSGSEAALVDGFTKAEANKTPFIGYAWQPWTLFAKMPNLETGHVKFPANDWTDAKAASGLTDYPSTPLVKLISKKLNDANDSFTTLVKNFSWTNADQNSVAADIEAGSTAAVAAQKWIDANPDKVKVWLGK
ncbi:MAG: glycine/betaine ABC transporter substrate-binding protein [Streptomycetaceae bacterium]|nr:MAG: glycine/betaine ABC transporter substrate-binding protein [Streptomycetaceae bacterium]